MDTRDQIPSDLTLEIKEDLSPTKFLEAVRAFFGCVEEVSKTVVQERALSGWTVKVYEGSSLIGMHPTSNFNPLAAKKIYSLIEAGVSVMARGQPVDPNFPENAIKHLKKLAELGTNTLIRLWVQNRPNVIGSEVATTIKEEWRNDYKDYGSIEGRIQAIQDKNGLKLRIKDSLLNINVNCYFEEELLQNVFENFRSRVEAYGVIHYRKNGIPVSINVDKIEKIPGDDELPSLKDVCGILS